MKKHEIMLGIALSKQRLRLLLNHEMTFQKDLEKQPEYVLNSRKYIDVLVAFEKCIASEVKGLSELLLDFEQLQQ